ncbi:MAG: hydroxymethylbilane synthase [Dehalococcoidales bacterium]|nr:hydroxymethylbilane synthase [Dehalococcoidales bacterium]
MKQSITIGTRGSRLALIQTELVAGRIKQQNHHLEVNITEITTQGDRDRQTRLDRLAGEGVFVKELEESLIDGSIDLAVHSLKDMPTRVPSGLALSAVLERANPGDVLVSRGGKLSGLPAGARIGTGSLRRAVQLIALRPDLKVDSIRGNVDTRVQKVFSGEFDGVILAAAAMIRMGWHDKVSEYLSLEDFLPAVGQGAMVVETRSDDEDTVALVSMINHLPTWHSVTAERAFLDALGGGCRAPIAALGTVTGDTLKLEGMVAEPGGKKRLRLVEEGKAADAEAVGRQLAQRMLSLGAAEFISEVT